MNVATSRPLAYEVIDGKRYLRLTDEWRAARYTAARREAERKAMRVELHKSAELLVAKNPVFFTHFANGTLGEINQSLDASGMTLLHLSARLYALAARRYDRKGQDYYAAATKCLLDAGANPFNTMKRWSQYDDEGRHGTSLDTPAAACDGNMPPALRDRMQAEAAAGHIPAFRPSSTDALVVERKPRPQQARRKNVVMEVRFVRKVEGVTDTGKSWIAQLPDGHKVAEVDYDPEDHNDRCRAHHDAAKALREWRKKMRKQELRSQAERCEEVAAQSRQRRQFRAQLALQSFA